MIKVHDINCDLLNDLNDLISLIINSRIYDSLQTFLFFHIKELVTDLSYGVVL